jgi:dimethylargininase
VSIFRFDCALLRTPAASVVDGLRAGDGPSPTHAGLLAEHQAYVVALERAGLAVEVLGPLQAFPDSVFVEDPALAFAEGAILLRPGAPSRAGEVDALAPTLRRRFPRVLELAEGHVDGGDVLVTPKCVFIGLSDRTDAAGARALVEALDTLDRPARVVAPPAGVLHLKSACALIDEETMLVTPALAASGLFDGWRVLQTPPGEEAAANLVRANQTLLIAAGHPRTREMLETRGLEVVALETAHVARIDAGLSCMSLRWASA